MSRKAKLVVILAAVGLSVAVFLWWNRVDQARETISVSGNIELTQVQIAFKIPGRLVELAVDEGESVEEGKVLARLDQEELLKRRRQVGAAIEAAGSRVSEMQALVEFQRESLDAQRRLRQAQLVEANAALEELLSGSRQQEAEQARAAVRKARAEYEKSERDWRRAQTLYEKDDISTAQYDQFRAAFEAARASLAAAEQGLDLVLEGPRREDIARARARVEQARAALEQAQAQRLEIEKSEHAVKTAQAEKERAQAELEVIDIQIEDTVAVSPLNGVVLMRSAEVGEVLPAGVAVLTVADLENPWVRGYIQEQDLGRVKLGSSVRVATDSFPGKVYPGHVSFIASQAEFTPKQIQTPEERVKLVYRIKIAVRSPNQELKLNMPVDAQIVLTENSRTDAQEY